MSGAPVSGDVTWRDYVDARLGAIEKGIEKAEATLTVRLDYQDRAISTLQTQASKLLGFGLAIVLLSGSISALIILLLRH